MLDNISVLDVTQVVSGSFASMNLADMGAEVVKIERPAGGDIGRDNPPHVGPYSSYYASVNRNKKSVSLDLKSERGRSLFLELAEKADVVVENFTPGTMDEFGLGYDDVSDINPEIIYCSITGFGQDGPYSDYPALDIVAQAMSGNMSITGPPDGKPYRAGMPIADIAGSMYAVQAILGALIERNNAEQGQHIDIAMLDAVTSWLTVRAGYTFGTGKAYPRMGNELEEFVPYGVFETQDSYLTVVVVHDQQWRNLCEVIGREDLATDERFATADARRENRSQVREILENQLAEETTEEWFHRLAEQGVPAGPIYNTKELWEDDHIDDRGVQTEIELNGEQFPVIETPIQSSRGLPGISDGVSQVGEESREKLAELGYGDSEIDALINKGVVGNPETAHPK